MTQWQVQKTYEGTTSSGEVVRQVVTGPTGSTFELATAMVHSIQMIEDEKMEAEGHGRVYTRLLSVELVRLNDDGSRYISPKPVASRPYGAV